MDPLWVGKYVACVNMIGPDLTIQYLTPKGKFLVEPIECTSGIYFGGFGPTHVFDGLTLTTLFSGRKVGGGFYHLYSNQVSLPKAISKPQVVYFKASAEPLDGNSFVVLWSAAGCSSVLIKGKGVKLKKLPPVGCATVEVKGKKLRLTIIARGPGGKAGKSIKIKP
jgi:hypothetical protein